MQFIFPPRPKRSILPKQLPFEEARNVWLWQPKYDGDRCVVLTDGKRVEFYNRHGRKNTKLSHLVPQVLNLNTSGQTCLDGELLGTKIVLFDVLRHNNRVLTGVRQVDRLQLLEDICRNPTKFCDEKIAKEIAPDLWLSLNGTTHFAQTFDRMISSVWVEGILLRQRDSVLNDLGLRPYEVDWQLRCRKNTKNYRY